MSIDRIRLSRGGGLDAAHLRAVPRKQIESVAPNVLRDLKAFEELEEDDYDEEELLRLLTQDEIRLSEEAQELLRKLRKRKKRGRGRQREDSEEEFLALLDQLEDLEPPAADPLPHRQPSRPFLPPVLTLSTFRPVDAPLPQRTQETAPSRPRLSKAGKAAADMVAIAPDRESVLQVAHDLEVFGKEMILEVYRFGTRIIIVDGRTPLTEVTVGGTKLFGAGEKTFDGRPWSVVRGVYSAKRRVICIGQELLNQSRQTGRSTVRHEFAHAYEDAWSKKRQRHHPLSVELWYRFEATRQSFISQYASTQPAEYFAESVEAFFMPNHRETLRHADPDMHRFLSELFTG